MSNLLLRLLLLPQKIYMNYVLKRLSQEKPRKPHEQLKLLQQKLLILQGSRTLPPSRLQKLQGLQTPLLKLLVKPLTKPRAGQDIRLKG
jgi:hypothetical protein